MLRLCVCMYDKRGQGSAMHTMLKKNHETKMKNHPDLLSVCVCLLTFNTQIKHWTVLCINQA